VPSLPRIPRAALGPVLLASFLVLLVFWRTPAARPGLAPPSAVTLLTAPEQLRDPALPSPTSVPLTGELDRRLQLDLVSAEGLFAPEEQTLLFAEVEQALAYVSRRFGATPQDRIGVYIGWEPACALHGIAYSR
jgi:hypothetical protein